MIRLDTIKEIIRARATNRGRLRQEFITSDNQVSRALEFAISKAAGKKRDVWGKSLIIEADDFVQDIAYYFRHLPDVTTNYTDDYIAVVPATARHTPAAKRSSTAVYQYLRIELA